MPRLMSVRLTEDAVRERRKTVTRRLGWTFLKPGDRLTLCRKVQGRKPGEPLVRLAEVEVVSVRRERLWADFDETDIPREGVPHLDGPEIRRIDWCLWFCGELGIDPYVAPNTEVTRIEWRYLDPDPLPLEGTA